MNVFLAIKRRVVTEFRKHRVSAKPRCGQAFFNRLWRLVGNRDVFLASPTRVFDSVVLDHFPLRRDVLKLLAAFHADLTSRLSAARARELFFAQFVTDHFAAKVLWQPAATVRFLARLLVRVVQLALFLLLKFSGELLQFFKRKQQQLIRIDAFLP